jgi:hypothetical protein
MEPHMRRKKGRPVALDDLFCYEMCFGFAQLVGKNLSPHFQTPWLDCRYQQGNPMNQNNNSSSSLSFSTSTPPAPLSRFLVRSYAAMPVPLNPGERTHDEYDGDADIRAVGVGPLGAKMVQLLARNLPGVTCHEIVPDVGVGSSDEIAALLSSFRASHLVFILTGFDDEYSESISQTVGGAACEAGVLTLVITPHTGCLQDIPPQSIDGQSKWHDTMFNVSDVSLPSQQEPAALGCEALTGYAMRHMAGVVTNLISHSTGICIDFNDIVAVMRSGRVGRMAVGISSGDSRGRTAALLALERLEAQGVSISLASGVLVSVHGSSELSMEDYDDVSRVIHDHTSDEANVIVGLISDEQMGYNVKVSVLVT